jgi:pimeloyl-ACP methyl ester carboxylesterase
MPRARFFAPTAAVLLITLGGAHATEQTVAIAGMKVTVWSQPAGVDLKEPVVIFSHGFHGCATQSRFLMQAFASNGYLVFAPNHRDAACGGGAASWLAKPEVPFRAPQNWDDTSYRDRADDIRRLLDAIRTDERFKGRVDLSRVALAGHSLGGYTVLGLCGAWPVWRLAGVKAVLALSPYAQPFVQHHTLGGLSAPVMYQGGTRDFGITPALRKVQGAYDQSPPPKYYVEFDKAGHFAWTNIGRTAHDSIVAYSLAFMNYYVKGEPADPVLGKALPGVVTFRHTPASSGMLNSESDASIGPEPSADTPAPISAQYPGFIEWTY